MLIDRLIELRKTNKYTKKRVAEVLNITPEGYGHYESGKRKPNPEVIITLSRFYNVSADYLLGNTDNPAPPESRKATLEEIESGIMDVFESVGLFDPKIEISEKKRELIIKLTKTILESDM